MKQQRRPRFCHAYSPASPPVAMLAAAYAQSKSGSQDKHDAPSKSDGAPKVDVPDAPEVAQDPDGKAMPAKGLPEVCQPTAEEQAKHALTHLPYRRWCKWCVAARMLNVPHWVRPSFSRDKPLRVFDECFLKHSGQEKCLTVLVARLYPSRAIFGVSCYSKGPHPFVTRRLAAFLRACGVSNFSFMSDQEGSIRTMIDEAIQLTKGRGEWVGAVQE